MSRVVGMLTGLAAVMVVGTSAAFAQSLLDASRGHHHTAPAPLLAAGIPAFIALGGGVLFNRMFRRNKQRD